MRSTAFVLVPLSRACAIASSNSVASSYLHVTRDGNVTARKGRYLLTYRVSHLTRQEAYSVVAILSWSAFIRDPSADSMPGTFATFLAIQAWRLKPCTCRPYTIDTGNRINQ